MNGIDSITISSPHSDESVTLTPDELENATNELEQAVDDVPVDPDEKFVHAPVVMELANRLISTVERFGHLAEARIAYLFRNTRLTTDWVTKDRVVMGKAYVNDERQRFLSGYDLQVVINKRVWDLADASQREALLAHELCHFEALDPDKNGNPRWRMKNHDVEEFAYIVRRYGIWDESLRRFMAAKEEGEMERNQVRMFPDNGESDSA